MIRVRLDSRPKVFLRKHSRRDLIVRTTISVTFVITLIVDAYTATHLALIGNLAWLWIDFDEVEVAIKNEENNHA